jgi:hypothetical protein
MNLSELNKQLQNISHEYVNEQRINDAKSVINKHNEELNVTNNRLVNRQYESFLPPIVNTQHITTSTQPSYTRNVNQVNKLSDSRNVNYNNQSISPSYRNKNDNINYNKEQYKQSILTVNQEDLRVTMNTQMDKLRFDEKIHMNKSLIPVDMEHIYSGNIFQDGTPIPQDILRNHPNQSHYIQSQSNNQSHNSRILLQNKSKTSYRNDFNDRLSELSPFNQQFFQPKHNFVKPTEHGGISLLDNPTSGSTMYNDKINMHNSIRDDMNTRMSQFSSLPSTKPLPDGKTVKYRDTSYIPNPNKDYKKEKYNNEKLPIQELTPVMSNY